MRNGDGRVNGIFVEGVDVTEVVNQAQVLRESEEKFRSFAQLAPYHMWTASAQGQSDWYNDTAIRYSGLDLKTIVGQGWEAMVHPEDLAEVQSSWTTALVSGSDYEAEIRIRRADGIYRWHLVRALPVRDVAGKTVRWVGTNTDIEDQRADRDRLRKVNVNLEREVDERTRERERIWSSSPDLIHTLDQQGIFFGRQPGLDPFARLASRADHRQQCFYVDS